MCTGTFVMRSTFFSLVLGCELVPRLVPPLAAAGLFSGETWELDKHAAFPWAAVFGCCKSSGAPCSLGGTQNSANGARLSSRRKSSTSDGCAPSIWHGSPNRPSGKPLSPKAASDSADSTTCEVQLRPAAPLRGRLAQCSVLVSAKETAELEVAGGRCAAVPCPVPQSLPAPRRIQLYCTLEYRYDPNVRRTDDDEYPGTGTY